MTLPDRVPSYDELLAGFGGAPPGASWKVFGDGDQVGTLNFLTPARVAHAATLARAGKVFSLDYPVNSFEPFPSGTRHAAEHRRPCFEHDVVAFVPFGCGEPAHGKDHGSGHMG